MAKYKSRMHSLYRWLRKNPIASITVLEFLNRTGITRTGDIAKGLDLSRGVVTKILKSMEAKGWIEVRPDPHDRRIRTVAYTREGSWILGTKKQELESIIGQLD